MPKKKKTWPEDLISESNNNDFLVQDLMNRAALNPDSHKGYSYRKAAKSVKNFPYIITSGAHAKACIQGVGPQIEGIIDELFDKRNVIESQQSSSFRSLGQWLESFNLRQHEARLRAAGFDIPQALKHLTDEMLELLGVEMIGHRLVILEMCKKLDAGDSSQPSSAPPSATTTAAATATAAATTTTTTSSTTVPTVKRTSEFVLKRPVEVKRRVGQLQISRDLPSPFPVNGDAPFLKFLRSFDNDPKQRLVRGYNMMRNGLIRSITYQNDFFGPSGSKYHIEYTVESDRHKAGSQPASAAGRAQQTVYSGTIDAVPSGTDVKGNIRSWDLAAYSCQCGDKKALIGRLAKNCL